MNKLLTPKQVAQAIGVSEASLKRWCDKGVLPAVRTEGGHRRLALDDVLEFIRCTGRPIVSPEVLQLPPLTAATDRVALRSQDQLYAALTAGDEMRARRIIFDLYLAKYSVADIGDRLIAETFRQIGDKWECKELEPYQERRACELLGRVLTELRSVMPPPAHSAPLAIGGTLEGDQYRLANMLVELVLRERGWRAELLGTNLPVNTLKVAIEAMRPSLVWLSVSHITSAAEFLESYGQLYEAGKDKNVAVAVGGRALDSSIRCEMQYTVFCDTLRHLVSYVSSLNGPARP